MNPISAETWRGVFGFPDYEVSDAGRVRSIKRGGRRVLKPQRHTGGYHIVTFWSAGSPTIHLVQKLVLEAFVGTRPTGQQACHGNGDKADNRLENLRWDTPKANQADRVAHGTRYGRAGSKGRRRITPAIVTSIRAEAKPNITALARTLRLPRTTVADVVNRRTYKEI